jgi:hypothetical protein
MKISAKLFLEHVDWAAERLVAGARQPVLELIAR